MFIRRLTYASIISAGLWTIGQGIKFNSTGLIAAGTALISFAAVLWITRG